MNLDAALHEHARTNPNQLAVGWEANSYTYKELDRKVQRLANQFRRNGIEKGDRIAIILANCPEFILSYYACMRVGAISVPINPSLTPREYSVIINDSLPKYIVTNPDVYKKLVEVTMQEYPKYLLVDVHSDSFHSFLQGGVPDYIAYEMVEECTIIYTSGTTGTPKGAVLTHDNLYHNAKTFAEAFGMTNEDKTLIVAPVFHSAAQSNCLNTMIYSGGYSYLLPRWKSSENTLRTMEKEEITFFFGPPTMYTYILNDPNISEYHIKLRNAYTGASPLPEEIFNKWFETFGFKIVEGYGLTETSPVVTVNPPYGIKKLRSVGLPIKDVEVKIVNELFEEVKTGKTGELLVKGSNVMKGYWNRPEENEAAFVDGWFRTGDIAKKDHEGYIYIVDRKKDMIIRSGFNVYPREIEEVLYQHPAVLEAAVIGYPDADKGELVKAVVTLKDESLGYIADELKEYCREYLATYKVPEKIEIVKELPKTTTGKILKTMLREIYQH
jgi:long-chain acyl-CoA synthetase